MWGAKKLKTEEQSTVTHRPLPLEPICLTHSVPFLPQRWQWFHAMQACETNNNIHRHNHAIKADEDSRSSKRTALYINQRRLADKKKKNYRGIHCKSCALTSPRVSVRKWSKPGSWKRFWYQQKGQKTKLQDGKQGAAEVPSTGEQASRNSKKQKSHRKKLNCSIYSTIAREFDKVLEE